MAAKIRLDALDGYEIIEFCTVGAMMNEAEPFVSVPLEAVGVHLSNVVAVPEVASTICGQANVNVSEGVRTLKGTLIVPVTPGERLVGTELPTRTGMVTLRESAAMVESVAVTVAR